MYLVLLGAPGAGKGTQASAIADRFGWVHLASGDLLRAEVAKGSEPGKQAKSYMDKGALVPDDMVIQMILKRLEAPDTGPGVILDGFPRTIAQAEALDKALARQGKKIDWALYISVPSDELVARISGRWICRQCQMPYHSANSPPRVAGTCDKCSGKLYQRSDDTEATVRERLKVYFAQTTPVLDYYRKKSNLLEVEGRRSIEIVTGDVIKTLDRVKGSSSDNRKIR